MSLPRQQGVKEAGARLPRVESDALDALALENSREQEASDGPLRKARGIC